MKIHHIGYLVENIKCAVEVFLTLGYEIKQYTCYDSDRDIDVCFLENNGVVVELVAPRESSQNFKALRKRIGNAPYHICYVADDFLSDINRLEKNGYCVIIPPRKSEPIEGRKCVFLYHQEIGLIEILEK